VSQRSKEDESTIDDAVETDIFEDYKSPDVNDSVNKRNIYNVISIVTKASAIIAQYGFIYEMVMGYFNVGMGLGGTLENPMVEYDITKAVGNFGNASILFAMGVALYYSGKYFKNKYDEKSQLLNILIGKREEKRLGYFLKKKETSY
jgi:hypothetical protein